MVLFILIFKDPLVLKRRLAIWEQPVNVRLIDVGEILLISMSMLLNAVRQFKTLPFQSPTLLNCLKILRLPTKKDIQKFHQMVFWLFPASFQVRIVAYAQTEKETGSSCCVNTLKVSDFSEGFFIFPKQHL